MSGIVEKQFSRKFISTVRHLSQNLGCKQLYIVGNECKIGIFPVNWGERELKSISGNICYKQITSNTRRIAEGKPEMPVWDVVITLLCHNFCLSENNQFFLRHTNVIRERIQNLSISADTENRCDRSLSIDKIIICLCYNLGFV